MKRSSSLIIASLLIACNLVAQSISFNESFSSGMVLQRDMKIEIWGTSSPNQTVTVEVQGKKKSTISDRTGTWQLQMNPLKAGGPFVMKAISGSDTTTIDEVYVGEVWIAGGQSNMGFLLQANLNATKHITNATNENIRFMNVPQKYYQEHNSKEQMEWTIATKENVGKMSAVAYFFAQRLQQSLNVPIGIIGCYKGGTPAESWMSRSTIAADKRHRPIIERYEAMLKEKGADSTSQEFAHYTALLREYYTAIKAGNKEAKRPVEPMGPYNPKRPYGLYDHMLKRIMPFTTRGTIWYQGEANAARSAQYRSLFPALIQEWRADFKNPTMYFYFVQLSNYDHPNYNYPAWAELREAQTLTAHSVPRTAMALSIDYGEKNDIHPREKSEVGSRLAGLAMNNIYGEKQVCQGPRYVSMKRRANRIHLTFHTGGTPLTVRSNEMLKGFTICGADFRFVAAQAQIQDNKVIVWADGVNNPVAVRYGWANWSEGNLFNSSGLPATPFRTDKEPLITTGKQ